MTKRKSNFLLHFILFIVFFVIACLITFPLIFNLTKVTTGYGDELLISWILNWDIYKILQAPIGFFNLFDTNSYFPYHNTLAYSDLHLTSAFISLIPVLFLKEPIVANNFVVISSIALLGFCTYFFSFYLTKNFHSSFFSGLLVQFSPAVLDKITQLQVLAIYFLPLGVYFLANFLKKKKIIYYLLFLLVLILQIYNSFMPGYFIVLTSVLIILFFVLKEKQKAKFLLSKWVFFPLLLTLVLIAPAIIPYYQVSNQFNYTRDIRDSIHFALQPEDLLSTNPFSKFNNLFSSFSFNTCNHNNCEVKPGFIGGVFSLLSVLSIVYLFKNWKKQEYIIKALFTGSLLGFVLSLGPFLHIARYTIHNPFPIPLPYAVFYYILPGFNGFRNSSRFELMFIMLMAILISYVLFNVFKKIGRLKLIVVYLILFLGIVLEFNFPIKFYPVPKKNDFPKVYSWLNTTDKKTVFVEMPIFTWNMSPYVFNENWRLYYSTSNFRNMINGASGFSPAPWQRLVMDLLKHFPSDNAIDKLRRLGVNLVIVHKDEYDVLNSRKFVVEGKKIENGQSILNSLKNNKNIELVKKFNGDYVFRIK
jgi:hypothetical protein